MELYVCIYMYVCVYISFQSHCVLAVHYVKVHDEDSSSFNNLLLITHWLFLCSTLKAHMNYAFCQWGL